MNLLINADARQIPLADGSVNCIVTSPPYYGIISIMNEPRDSKGRFIKGIKYSPATQFKKNEHWRERMPYWDREWLRCEYEDKFRSAKDIADQFGITEAAIFYWLRRHKIKRRNMIDIRAKKYWGSKGEKNGMFGKNGEANPYWKGGITQERQAFYASQEWKDACSEVYKRDNAKCKRCGSSEDLQVHHIISFRNKELRSNIDNLVLLCKTCHNFVHSKKNINKEYIGVKHE